MGKTKAGMLVNKARIAQNKMSKMGKKLTLKFDASKVSCTKKGSTPPFVSGTEIKDGDTYTFTAIGLQDDPLKIKFGSNITCKKYGTNETVLSGATVTKGDALVFSVSTTDPQKQFWWHVNDMTDETSCNHSQSLQWTVKEQRASPNGEIEITCTEKL